MKSGLYFICILLCSLQSSAQITFEKMIDTLASSFPYCIQQTFDGGYVYSANMSNANNALIVKLDSTGTLEWTRIYGNANGASPTYMEQTPDSGFIVNGMYYIGTNSYNWLLRLDQYGDSLWSKTYTAGTSGLTVNFGNSMATIGNTLYGLTGYTSATPTGIYQTGLIICFSNGAHLTSKIYNTPFGFEGRSVCRTIDGGFAITGDYVVGLSSTTDIGLIRTNGFGDTLWTRHYDLSYAEAGYDLKSTIDSGFVIAGIYFNPISNKYNMRLIKTDSFGDIEWTREYFNNEEQNPTSIQQTYDGGYIITGTVFNGNNMYDVFLMKTDVNGDSLWTKCFGGPSSDYGSFVRQTSDHGYILSSKVVIGGIKGSYIIKTDSLGIIFNPTHLTELNNPLEFEVYPNPGKDKIFIKSPTSMAEQFELEIYDIQGKLIYENLFSGNLNSVSTEAFPSSVYYCKLNCNGLISFFKLVVVD